MSKFTHKNPVHLPESRLLDKAYYRELRRRNILRLILTYLAPLILLSIYFYIQNRALLAEGSRLHLRAIAESQANTLDLYLSERLVNVANLIDDPKFQVPPTPAAMQTYHTKLEKSSSAFVDVGFFDSAGIQTAYAGPYPSLERRNYSSEPWYMELRNKLDNFIITDIYLGFRQEAHFTIAVSRVIDDQYVVLRATLDPEGIYEFIKSVEGSADVYTSIVNKEGYYQLVTERIGTPLETSSFVPSETPRFGAAKVKIDGKEFTYAYSWLRNADWALIVQQSSQGGQGSVTGFRWQVFGIAAAVIFVSLFVIIHRSRTLVEWQMESDKTRIQLEHAAKLASVGELAAGIAHEINNPLAVINEEAGLMKDLIDPEYEDTADAAEMNTHLDNIQESVFRCRDITRKLLGFVRSKNVDLRPHNVHRLIDDVVDGLLVRELAVANIEIAREYEKDIPALVTDANQLQQVLLNMINNSVDAIGNHAGRIAITTAREDNDVRITVSDTGSGMSREQLEQIFLPFYTTKEVGKGTGLGLSVSYGIIKNLGGRIEVESAPGKGSSFIIVLPVA
jgi:two-component system NtrC family sensor kinase